MTRLFEASSSLSWSSSSPGVDGAEFDAVRGENIRRSGYFIIVKRGMVSLDMLRRPATW